jgi:hypothetical protein
MHIHKILFLLLFDLFLINCLPGINPGDSFSLQSQPDTSVISTLIDNQILFNGRVWRNRYYLVKEDQFFLTKEFLPGSVTIGGKTFNNLDVRYDIYSDQIMIPIYQGPILQLNKEMVDSFSLSFMNETWRFTNIKEDSLNLLNGYVNVLYEDKSELYVKYSKAIALLAVDKKYDKFYQLQKIFFVKNNIPNHITGVRNFLKLFGEDEQTMKDYIKKNRLVLSKKRPESFIPAIQFYDNLKK